MNVCHFESKEGETTMFYDCYHKNRDNRMKCSGDILSSIDVGLVDWYLEYSHVYGLGNKRPKLMLEGHSTFSLASSAKLVIEHDGSA